MVANPVDARLYADLERDVFCKIRLPPAPSLSDSEDPRDDDTSSALDESASRREGSGHDGSEGGTKKEADIKGEVEVGVCEQADRGQISIVADGNVYMEGKRSPGQRTQQEESRPGNDQRASSPSGAKEVACPELVSAGDSHGRNGGPSVAPASGSKKCSCEPVEADDAAQGEVEANNSPKKKHGERDQQHGALASPLRDRPPTTLECDTRSYSAPPSLDPSTPPPAPSPRSSKDRTGGSMRVDGKCKGRREHEGRYGTGKEAGAAAPAPVPSSLKHTKSGHGKGGVNGREEAKPGSGKGAPVARNGRKRPRTSSSTPDKTRDRKPPSKPRDKGDGDGAEPRKEELKQGASREGEQFRRIALEVWDRVSKRCHFWHLGRYLGYRLKCI